MISQRALHLGWTFLIVLAVTATADQPIVIHDGDRITGTLPVAGAEAGFALDGLEGTVLTLKARDLGDSGVEPEILLFGPDDVRVLPGPRYRHSPGSSKARLRKYPLPMTGRYTIVVRAAGASSGTYKLKVRVDHPDVFRDRGGIPSAGASSLMRFPAFAGTRMRYRVRGTLDLEPSVETLLAPGVVEVDVEAAPDVDGLARGTGHCEEHGDYRLRIAGREGTTGSWKCKVRLEHPEKEPATRVVHGLPAGTFTTGMSEPPPIIITPPPPGAFTYRILESGLHSAITTAENVVARTAMEYSEMWARHRPPWPPGIGAPEVPPPQVDFATEMVVAVFLGHRTFSERVTFISVAAGGGGLQTAYLEIPGMAAGVTHPYEIIAVTRVSGPVTFAHSIALVVK
jgi:hypothetical protein